jgi:hypothetical protein
MAFMHYGPFLRHMRKLCMMKLFWHIKTWVAVHDESVSQVRAVVWFSGESVNLGWIRM